MEIIIYNILKAIVTGWFLSTFEPYHIFKDFIFKKMKRNKYTAMLHFALGCGKCLTFWTGFILSGNFFVAALAAMLYYTYDKIINSIKTYL
jgi:hypothetical protein